MRKCKWCGGAIIISHGPISRPEWSRWRCRSCGSMGYVDNPDINSLSRIYEEAWKDFNNIGKFASGSTDIDIAESLIKAVGFDGCGKCLDYGGGKGCFAKALKNYGCNDIYVYEPYGNNPGINSVKWERDFDFIKTNKYDWIFLIEVIEHFLDPIEELKKIKNILCRNGRIVITTPNSLGWRARKEGFMWREANNPTHINLFSEKSLRICLSRAGFENAERVYRPVRYKAKGVKGLFLTMTQLIGVDGGLRMVVNNDKLK